MIVDKNFEEGISLEQVFFNKIITDIKRETPVDLHQILAWFRDLAFALDWLHLHLFAHKMICPANIFLSKNRLVLGEFGHKVALKLGTCFDMRDFTAPAHDNDALISSVNLAMKNDMWSLGCVFLEMVYFSRPVEEGKGSNDGVFFSQIYQIIYKQIIKKYVSFLIIANHFY